MLLTCVHAEAHEAQTHAAEAHAAWGVWNGVLALWPARITMAEGSAGGHGAAANKKRD